MLSGVKGSGSAKPSGQQDRRFCGVEAESRGANNTVGRSEGKITTVETAFKPAKCRVGHLYLKGGTWEGRQVVSAAYVRASTQTHVPTGDTHAPGHGYQWWIMTEQGHRGFAAIGLGGQLIEVIPTWTWSW
jgi:hypothetical protein